MAETNQPKRALAVLPRRTAGFIWRKMDAEAVLFNPGNNETYMLNPTAAAIWELCDGAHSVEDISGVVAQKFEAGNEEILHDVAEFIAQGKRDGYILTSE